MIYNAEDALQHMLHDRRYITLHLQGTFFVFFVFLSKISNKVWSSSICICICIFCISAKFPAKCEAAVWSPSSCGPSAINGCLASPLDPLFQAHKYKVRTLYFVFFYNTLISKTDVLLLKCTFSSVYSLRSKQRISGCILNFQLCSTELEHSDAGLRRCVFKFYGVPYHNMWNFLLCV